MNKKQLSGLLDQLSARLEQASSDNKALYLENKSLQERCEKLTAEAKDLEAHIEVLKTEIEALKNQTSSLPEPQPQVTSITEETSFQPSAEISEPVTTSQVRLSEETEYAASVIGKIVVSATEHCNYLTSNANSANTKELINLILGKTEVLKAEILNIVYSPADFITKKALIDNQFDTARDYFASVKAQL